MKKYVVIALSVNGKRKLYKFDDEVDEDCFPPGRAAELADQGFLKCIGSDVELPKDVNEVPEIIPNKNTIRLEEVTINQMKKDLRELNVEFPNNASKKDLFEIWQKSKV